MKFWMCYLEGTDGCQVKYKSEGDARREAEQFASLKENRGKKVFLLESIYFVQASDPSINWYPIPEPKKGEVN